MKSLGRRITWTSAALAIALAACSHAAALDGPPGDAADTGGSRPGGGDAAATTRELCDAVCALLPRECRDPDCVVHCEAFVEDPRCGIWSRPLIACQAKTSPEDNFCVMGHATLKEGPCTTEARMSAACQLNGPSVPTR
jgi:hypothetical protein